MNYSRLFNAQNYRRVSSAFGSTGFIARSIYGVHSAPNRSDSAMIIISPILIGMPCGFLCMTMWPGMIIPAPYYFYNKKFR